LTRRGRGVLLAPMSDLCSRCGQREALRPSVVIGFAHGAYCAQCAAAMMDHLLAQVSAPPLPPDVTAAQVVAVWQRFWGAAAAVGPGASPEDLRKSIERRMRGVGL